jgi:hypothetical protein
MKIGVKVLRNTTISICLIFPLALPSCVSGTDKLDAVMLKDSEIPKECEAIDGKYPTDLQTQILYERYDMYKQLLPPLAGKQAKSFKCGRQKGTIFYFECANVADRVEAEGGVRRLLWGEDHSTSEHPEQIEHAENLLLVISFGKAPDTLLAAIRAKLPKGVTPS